MADINSDRMDDAIEEMGGFIFPTPFDFLLSYFIYIYMYIFIFYFSKNLVLVVISDGPKGSV